MTATSNLDEIGLRIGSTRPSNRLDRIMKLDIFSNPRGTNINVIGGQYKCYIL